MHTELKIRPNNSAYGITVSLRSGISIETTFHNAEQIGEGGTAAAKPPGRVTSMDAGSTGIRLDIEGAAKMAPPVEQILIFTSNFDAVERLLDPSPHRVDGSLLIPVLLRLQFPRPQG
jgi:hypothetical protein